MPYSGNHDSYPPPRPRFKQTARKCVGAFAPSNQMIFAAQMRAAEAKGRYKKEALETTDEPVVKATNGSRTKLTARKGMGLGGPSNAMIFEAQMGAAQAKGREKEAIETALKKLNPNFPNKLTLAEGLKMVEVYNREITDSMTTTPAKSSKTSEMYEQEDEQLEPKAAAKVNKAGYQRKTGKVVKKVEGESKRVTRASSRGQKK